MTPGSEGDEKPWLRHRPHVPPARGPGSLLPPMTAAGGAPQAPRVVEPVADRPSDAKPAAPQASPDQGSPVPATPDDGRAEERPPDPVTFDEIEPPAIGDPGSQLEFISQLATDWPGRADTIIDAGISGALDVRAASIRGKSHRDRRDSPFSTTRQDEYCFQLTSDGRWLVVFVADGVSAGEESHMAATIVARRGCNIVVGLLESGTAVDAVPWSDVSRQLSTVIVREWLKRRPGAMNGADLAKKSAEEAHELRLACAAESATTAIAALIRTAPDEDGTVPLVGVVLAGDSSLWLLEPTNGWRALSGIKNAGEEIASNATYGLPLVGEPEQTADRICPGAALFLMSDGLGDPLGGGTGEVGKYLAARWRRPPSGYAFASTLDFYRRSFDDDRTAVGIWLSER